MNIPECPCESMRRALGSWSLKLSSGVHNSPFESTSWRSSALCTIIRHFSGVRSPAKRPDRASDELLTTSQKNRSRRRVMGHCAQCRTTPPRAPARPTSCSIGAVGGVHSTGAAVGAECLAAMAHPGGRQRRQAWALDRAGTLSPAVFEHTSALADSRRSSSVSRITPVTWISPHAGNAARARSAARRREPRQSAPRRG
jgi:hypothetical protein